MNLSLGWPVTEEQLREVVEDDFPDRCKIPERMWTLDSQQLNTEKIEPEDCVAAFLFQLHFWPISAHTQALV